MNGCQRTILFRAMARLDDERVTEPRVKLVFPGVRDLDGPAGLHRQQRRPRVQGQRLLLASEGPAHEGAHDADLALRDSQGFGEQRALAVNRLGGFLYGELTAQIIRSQGGPGLQGKMGHPPGGVPVLHDDIGILKSPLHITERHAEPVNGIFLVFMNTRRVFGHGGFGIENGGQFFILDTDERKGVFGDVFGNGPNGRNPLAPVTDAIRGQKGFILKKHPDGFHERFPRNNTLHPGKPFRGRGVDVQNFGMRVRASQDTPKEHVVLIVVGPEFCSAGDFQRGVGSRKPLTDIDGVGHVSSRWMGFERNASPALRYGSSGGFNIAVRKGVFHLRFSPCPESARSISPA